MKVLIAVLVALVVAMAAGGGLIYQRQVEARESAGAELAKAREQLSLSAAAGTKKGAEADLLAQLYAKRIELGDTMVKGVLGAGFKYEQAQRQLLTSPSPDAYRALRSSLDELIDSGSKAQAQSVSLGEFLQKNRETLAPYSAITNEIDKFLATASGGQRLVERCRACRESVREAKLGVLSQESWQNIDLTVTKGDIFVVSASGDWSYAPSRRTLSGNHQATVTAQGEEWDATYKLNPQLPNGALMGRIHGSELMFPAGSGFAADRDGKLEFRINDTVLNDNKGTIDIVVWAFTPLKFE